MSDISHIEILQFSYNFKNVVFYGTFLLLLGKFLDSPLILLQNEQKPLSF